MARDTAATGAAGAYFVAGQLALRGWPASLTFGNTPRTDVLAQVGANRLPVAIQVKTKSEHSKDFQLGGISDYSPRGSNEWVILVALREAGGPDYFVLPRDHIRATVEAFELEIGGRNFLGEQEFSAYKDRWDLLEHPAWEAEWKVEDWVRKAAKGEGWPDERGPFPLLPSP
jgi:hypothetical protein